MRFPPPRPTLLALLALALSAATYARYVEDSTSARSQRRSLEKYGREFRDAIGNHRNTPSPRSSSESTSAWLDRMQAANEARDRAAKQASSQADYDRRAAERYADSQAGQDAAALARYQNALRAIAEEKAAEAAKIRAVRASDQALAARISQANWEKYRAQNHNFIPRFYAPDFPTPAAALAWCLAHDRESPNPWAAAHAAILQIDGYGVPADPAAAARLLDPRTRREPTGEKPRPELAALFAYLRARHPETCVPLGFPADPAAARRDLEALALLPHNTVASWYLARLLSESSDPADHKKALQLLPEGYAWMIEHAAGFLRTQAEGSFTVSRPVDATATAILARAAGQLPEALATWPLKKITAIAELVIRLPQPQLDATLMLFADAAAERYLTTSPSPDFPYSEFDYLLFTAGDRGSSSAFAIALFERLHLIRFDEAGRYTPTFRRLENVAYAFPALARWAPRDDALGVRARLALTALAFEVQTRAASSSQPPAPIVLPEPFASVTTAIERYRALSMTDAAAKAAAIKAALQAVQSAMARRDASAPPASAMPSLLGSLGPYRRQQDQLLQLNEQPRVSDPSNPALFAIESDSFNLDRAARHFDAAVSPDFLASTREEMRLAKQHALFEATRLGDAFAPRALAQDFDLRETLTPPAREKLRTLSDARRARDEAAQRPRATIARFLEACLRNTDPAPGLVATAAANGNAFAARLLFDQRLKARLSASPDFPSLIPLTPAQIAEFDAALLALEALPPTAAEWEFLSLLTTGDPAEQPVTSWFPHITRWEKDRQERLDSDALVQAVRPAFEALVDALGQWPGLNHEDSRNEDWLTEADQVYDKAKDLIATDGLEALTLCLDAAGRGNRDALQLLSHHFRHGLGTLPRSPEFADLILGAALKIYQADAELGDSAAAANLGGALLVGEGIAKNHAASRDWLTYAARRGDADAASELRHQASSDDYPRDPAAERHWSTVGIMIRATEHIPIPPRRLSPDLIELTPLLPALEAALTAADANLPALKTKKLTEEEIGTAYDLNATTFNEARYKPATGIVSLAQLASTGNQFAAFTTAQFLAGGLNGLRPDQPLARRFHALALALQQISAEFGNADDAYHLGLYHLELAEKPDVTTAIRWLTYAAELGHGDATICLRTLYTTGAPGIAPDAKAAARWTASGETIGTETFKPRSPLR